MKVKFLIAALFFSLVAAAQPSNYIKFNTRGRWIAGMFDSTLHVPRFNGSPSLRTGGSSMDGAIAIDTTNGIFYFYQGGSWKRANLDTSAYAVTNVYRKTASDSVFYVKGGVHTFAFKDSTGGSGWALTGNAGTDTATNFIGTTDSVGFRIRINNQPFGFFSEHSFGSLKLGYQALFKEPQNVLPRNIAIGSQAMYNNLSGGIDNIAIGWKALYANTTGSYNIGIGISSLLSNTTGIFNIAVGQDALVANTTGFSNTAIGFNSINRNTTGDYNTGVGLNSLYSNTTADYNTAIGSNSLYANTTGTLNSALGFQSMRFNTTGGQNSAFGTNSLYRNTTGQKNSALGAGALENNTSGDDNTAVGQDALLANTTGIRNIGIGWNGFANNFTGGQNVGIGYGAGKTITNGNNNTILGAFAAWDTPQNDTITGAVIIGHSATASEDSTVVLGNDYIKKTHLKGVVYAPFTTGDATTSDSALVVDRSTGALIMRPVAGGGTYTFTNGLTNSSGTVKLGGTLTEAITVLDGGVTNNLRFQDMQFEVTTSNTIMLGDSISFTGGSTPNRLSVIKLKNDTIKINPGVGLLYIDTLTSAVGTKALRYNPTTGLVSYADTTTGGSGGTPAGNYGNLQLNRNGAFDTPGSDSLDFTTGLDIKGHVGVSATSGTGIKFGGTTRIYDDGSLMRISPSGSAVQFYTAGVGNSLQIFNSSGSNSIVVDGQIGTIYRSSSTLSLQTSGNVGIGSGVGTTSTARLHISAGTASANTAPFKLTSGTNLTTPEAGAMEYNGTNLFFTPSSAARNNILMTASVNSVSPTSPNRTITIVVDGVTLYLHAKTTND